MNAISIQNPASAILKPSHDIGELAGDVLRNTPAYRYLCNLGDCIQWGGPLDETSYQVAAALKSTTDATVFLHVTDSSSYAKNRGFRKSYTVGIKCDCTAMAYTKSKWALND